MFSIKTIYVASMLQDYVSNLYNVLFYKKSNILGIRREFGCKEQCFSFGGSSGLSEAVLRGFADDAMKKLDDGETEDDVKEWADHRAELGH